MNLIKANAAITMSSREIADLTGKEHRNVRRDVERMAEELSLTFEQKTLTATGGRPSVVYLLPRREVEILLTGYSIPLRAKVIDRLHELEAAVPQQALPTSFAEALRLAASLEEEKQALVETNARLLPHAQVGIAAGQRKRLGVVEFARKLPGVNTQQVQKDLQARQYLHKRQGQSLFWCPITWKPMPLKGARHDRRRRFTGYSVRPARNFVRGSRRLIREVNTLNLQNTKLQA